ncbi:MAG: hypothetical protein ABEK01_05000 [Candidatus Nanohaloarchaea archaeon]
MLFEMILTQEREGDLDVLFVLGMVSAFIGFGLARYLFPSETALLTVFFGSMPLTYSLTKFFLEDEAKQRPHLPEIKVYGSLFVGQLLAFMVLGFYFPSAFGVQGSIIGSELAEMGITGGATSGAGFMSILVNNMVVFLGILVVSTLIGSSGAFILTWNASVLGVFIGSLLKALPNHPVAYILGTQKVPSPLAYLPHATFEMGGFIIAGITGSLMSAALYRRHFDTKTWLDFMKLLLAGAACVFIGVMIETA